jgi:hypothetical protein
MFLISNFIKVRKFIKTSPCAVKQLSVLFCNFHMHGILQKCIANSSAPMHAI